MCVGNQNSVVGRWRSEEPQFDSRRCKRFFRTFKLSVTSFPEGYVVSRKTAEQYLQIQLIK